MDKFCLKWNDFHQNASGAFKKLRKDKDFLDVTLVSEDGEHISAHKVVLSASSEFFKDTLKKANHKNPMIFLSGFHSKTLQAVLDYVYNGEVNLFQEEIDLFLESAQKLKIEGLTKTMKEENGATTYLENENESSSNEASYLKEELNSITTTDTTLPNKNFVSKRTTEVYNYDEYFTSCEVGWKCNSCGKTATTKPNMKVHVEIHMDGLSFPCQLCTQSFRSRNQLNFHKSRVHKP